MQRSVDRKHRDVATARGGACRASAARTGRRGARCALDDGGRRERCTLGSGVSGSSKRRKTRKRKAKTSIYVKIRILLSFFFFFSFSFLSFFLLVPPTTETLKKTCYTAVSTQTGARKSWLLFCGKQFECTYI